MTNPSLPLFYKRPQALTPEIHGNRSLRTSPGFAFAASTNALPLMAGEFPVACRDMPILFADGEEPRPVALVGLRANENLFVNADGVWEEDTYIPAYVRRYPFIFFEDQKQDTLTLCIDAECDAIVEGAENPFFIDAKPSPMVESALAFAKEFQAQSVLTREFAQAVRDADLLVERTANVALNRGDRLSLNGFKVIDEARFNALPAGHLATWRDRGWLGLAYAHLISISNLTRLVDRLARRS